MAEVAKSYSWRNAGGFRLGIYPRPYKLGQINIGETPSGMSEERFYEQFIFINLIRVLIHSDAIRQLKDKPRPMVQRTKKFSQLG